MLSPRPSGGRALEGPRPAGCMRPASLSSAIFARLMALQFDVSAPGVKRMAYTSSSIRE